jgi:DNA polymerase-1
VPDANAAGFRKLLQSGGDIHRQTAALIFDVPLEAVNSEMRARAKTINFATIYGQGAHALSRQLKIAHSEAKDFIEKYFQRFSRVREYLDSMVAFARQHGYVEYLQSAAIHPRVARSKLQYSRSASGPRRTR